MSQGRMHASKAMAEADVTAALGALSVDDSKRRRSLALVAPAVAERTVFISLESTAIEVNKLIEGAEGGTAVFIRAPVATGKSTLAAHLASSFPDRYIEVMTGETEAEWRHNIVKAVPSVNASGVGALSDALEAVADKCLIFDEAHLLFSFPKLMSALLKLPKLGKAPKYLLFSAAAHGGSDGEAYVTPSEIRAKYMWYPPMPDSNELSKDLQLADVCLSSQSVDFFLKLCGGHRGIFMSAMAWVQERQQSEKAWNLVESVAEVRASLADSSAQAAGGWDVVDSFRSAIAQSRAIRVNSKYSELINIPSVFADVLAGGARPISELENQHRALTIAGFLVPQQRAAALGEFVKYDWVDRRVRYGVSNALMAQYYNDQLALEMHLKSGLIDGMDQPTSCADLLSRALPFMSFVNVVESPTSVDGSKESPLSESLLPFEENYNVAISNVLKQLQYNVSNPQSQSLGKVDVYVTVANGATFALEMIMSERRPDHHKEHVDRFGDATKTNYSQATYKCLVTIGASSTQVLKRVVDTAAKHGVDIIGLVVSQAHDSFSMFVKSSGADDVKGPLFFICDHVAKSLQVTKGGGLEIVSAQKLMHIDSQEQKHDDDPFAMYEDETNMQVVVQAIAEAEGFTEEDVASDLKTLTSQRLRTVRNLRSLSVQRIEKLGMPPVVTEYLQRVKKGQ